MKKFGFTLAEVLIVLVILGVISALTVPNLMGTADEKARITAFKKGYAEINNALQLASAENGETPRSYHKLGKSPLELIQGIFVPTMKLTKVYQNGFQTADGITYLIMKSDGECRSIPSTQAEITIENACYVVAIDANGTAKGPNLITEEAVKGNINDRFFLLMFENGVIPGVSVEGDIIANNIYNNEAAAEGVKYSVSYSNTDYANSAADASFALGEVQ